MRVLLVNRFFTDMGAPTARIATDLVREFGRQGHRVTVLTTRGSYATSMGAEALPSCRVRYLPGRGGRLRRWLSMWFRVCFRVPFMGWDRCVFLTDPPFMVFAAWLALLVKPWRKCYWWTMDLYPEALHTAGVVREGGWLSRLLLALNDIGMRATRGVICLGPRQRERLARYRHWRHAPGFCLVQPPWDNRPLGRAPASQNGLAKTLGAKDRHVVLYAGNLGRGHSLADVIDAAGILQERGDETYHFAFVCRGARQRELDLAARALQNVTLHDYVPGDQLAELLWSARVHLITMADGWDGIIVPSKLYGVLKTDAPVLFIGPPGSDTAREIVGRKVGEVLANGCGGAAVVEALERLADVRLKPTRPDADAPRRVVEYIAS